MDNKMSGWREACHDGMTKMNIYWEACHDGMTKMNIYYLYNNTICSLKG